MMRTLPEWLDWQEKLHLSSIDLGLDRIRVVAERLDLLTLPFPVITVAGTNGKGSTVAFLHAMLSAQTYKTGAYTTPHIVDYNERIAVAGEPLADDVICRAFEKIDQARGEISLTYFEFGTLAAVLCFIEQQVDVAILEVGLGGRLDAVNLWDADLALITTIAIDHVDWLGDDRETIGNEKAGIMRAGQLAVCGEPNPPKVIAEIAKQLDTNLLQYTKDYTYTLEGSAWHWSGKVKSYKKLPLPALQGDYQLQNAAMVIAGLSCFKLNVDEDSIRQGLKLAHVAGRLQKLQDKPEILLDVAHNPQAAKQLAKYLEKNQIKGKTRAIFSILCDKDIESVALSMHSAVDEWHLVSLDDARAIPVEQLKSQLKQLGISTVMTYHDFPSVLNTVKSCSLPKDRVVIFGSFLVVSGVISVSSG